MSARTAAKAILAQRQSLAQAVVARQYDRQPELWQRYGASGQTKCVQDTEYHLGYLAAAVMFSSHLLFNNYIGWVKTVLTLRNIRLEDVEDNFACFWNVLQERLPKDIAAIAQPFIEDAFRVQPQLPSDLPTLLGDNDALTALARQYLQALLRAERHEASRLVREAFEAGVTTTDLYLQVFQRSQREIGRLWQLNQVTVAQEHYCTAATQLVMAQLYPYLFSQPKNGRRLVAASVAGELHEVGLRIVTDLFEANGWNTVYFGANVPAQSLMLAICQQRPDLLAISVTMAYHLPAVEELIALIRSSNGNPSVKIMVGGYPFNVDSELWRRVGADAYAVDANEALQTASRLLESSTLGEDRGSKTLPGEFPALNVAATPHLEGDVAATPHPEGDVARYDELSRLNSDLFTLQRELAKKNADLEREITERKRAEDYVRSIVDHILDGIISIDERGTVLSFNPAAETIFGFKAFEVLGQNVKILMPEPYHGEHDGYLARYLHTGQARIIGVGREVEGRRKDGSTFPMRLCVSEFRLGADRFFTGIVRNLSKQKELEAQFLQAQKMEVVGRLAGGVAHDFNNLLTVINGYSDILVRRSGLDERTRHLLREIHKAGQRAARLTRQLLAFSRQSIRRPKVLDLNDVLTDVENMLCRLIGEDIELVVLRGADLGRVNADPGQVEQVIINLAVNARDAMPTGGKLTLETASAYLGQDFTATRPEVKTGPYVLLRVTDTGCGMDSATQAHIFEPFFTTKELGKGTGLGLATLYGIIKQSEGHIDFSSEVGVGTTFRVYMPAVDAKPSEKSHAGVRVMPSGAETLLLVEDEEEVRALACDVLRGCGYTVLEAANGEEAKEVAAGNAGPIHLLVTDVVMPRIDGRQVAERLSAARAGVRVLYMSGYTDDAIQRHGISARWRNFLQKPFTPASLAVKVRQVLDRPMGEGE